MQRHGAQGAAQALPGRRGLRQPPLLPGAHQQRPGLCGTKAGGLTAERPGPEEGGLGGPGEGVLSPRGKGARSGVGGGLKREGRGRRVFNPRQKGRERQGVLAGG